MLLLLLSTATHQRPTHPREHLRNTSRRKRRLDIAPSPKACTKTTWPPLPQVLLVGDFNLAPSRSDVHATYDLPALFTQREQAAFAGLEAAYADVWRRLHPEEGATFTVFDERTSARPFNRGLRIDFALASPGLLAKVVSCEVVPTPPKWSDHVALALGALHLAIAAPFWLAHRWEGALLLCFGGGGVGCHRTCTTQRMSRWQIRRS